jgi:hypothetical protein
MPGIFAHIIDVLVQEILDLREALDSQPRCRCSQVLVTKTMRLARVA